VGLVPHDMIVPPLADPANAFSTQFPPLIRKTLHVVRCTGGNVGSERPDAHSNATFARRFKLYAQGSGRECVCVHSSRIDMVRLRRG
jgi:hypothetical protein